MFYRDVLGCTMGRRADTWVDVDFFGHQVSLHLGAPADARWRSCAGDVDGVRVPMPHFGVVLGLDAWQRLADRIAVADVAFAIPPRSRFAGEPHEQATFFIADPAGNPIEMKGVGPEVDLLATAPSVHTT